MSRARYARMVSLLIPIAFTSGCEGTDDEEDPPSDDPSVATDGFLDDFSAESLRFTLDRRPDERSERNYDVRDDRVVMTVSATSTDDQGQADLDAWGRSDSITARLSLDEAELAAGDRDARTLVRIAGAFWNDRADGGAGGRAGDVYVQLRLRAFGDGGREASICVDRDLEEGFEEVPLFDGDHCERVPDFVPELGMPYTLSLSVDREAGTLTYSVDERERTVAVGEPMFLPYDDRRGVQVTQEGPPGKSVGSVHAIGTDHYFQDFSTEPPVIGPYRPLFDLSRPGNMLSVDGGRARFVVPSSADADGQVTLNYSGRTDRIESRLELASASTLAENPSVEDNRVQVRLGGLLYRDIAESEADGHEGNVFASIVLRSDLDEAVALEYCAFRSNDADFSDTVELIGGGMTECGDFGIEANYDTSYGVSIEIDREAGAILYRADDVTRTFSIPTAIHAAPEGQFIGVQARGFGGSTSASYVDDFGTSASAPRVSAR